MPRVLSRILLLALGAGCVDRESIDSACAESIGGSSWANEDAVHYFSRVNCLRRYAGMSKVRLQRDIMHAVTDHAAYMTLHLDPTQPLTLDDLILENPNREGFTGVNDFDRVAARGNSVINGFSHGAWVHATSDVPEDRSAQGWADLVDAESDHFIYRQKFLQPSSWGVGLAVDGDWRYSFEVYDFPADERVTRPIVWPVDGQTDVPTTSFNYWQIEGYEVPYGATGYHITVTVGSLDGGSWVDVNPYGLRSSEARLVDASGDDVEFWLVTPESVTPGAFLYSIAAVPKEPLEAGTEYTFSVHLDWQDFSKDVETTFITSF
jgi:hypothetical protein